MAARRPNGSGKSTFASSAVFETLLDTPETKSALERLNPDDRARQLRAKHPRLSDEALALRAAAESDAHLDRLIAAGRSVLVETVLSSDKLKARVETAQKRGMTFALTFVTLRRPDLNIARVTQRVGMGGHAVPANKVRERWVRSMDNLVWFAARADTLSVWDNTRSGFEAPPELVLAATREGHFVNPSAAVFADPDTHVALKGALDGVIAGLRK